MIMQRSVYLLEIDDGLIVVPWNCVLLVAHAKHIRAEMLNSNTIHLLSNTHTSKNSIIFTTDSAIPYKS